MSDQPHEPKDITNTNATTGATDSATTESVHSDHVPLPQVDFSTFVLSMASSAMVHLGEAPNPEDGKTEVVLPLAKHTIDIIEMLKSKIEKGLTAEEQRLLDGLLYELRMKYVLKSK